MNSTSNSRRFLVREGLKDFMVWDREIRGPALVDGQPVVGFSKEQAIKIRDALNEPALAGEIKPHPASYMPVTSPSLSRSNTQARSGLAHEGRAPFPEHSTFAESIADTFGIRPDCPDCGMHMIIVRDVSIVPGRRTYECLRCGHASEPDGPRPRPPAP